MSGKRRRDEDESESFEQRLVNLVVRIGDKNVQDLPLHLETLASTLSPDIKGDSRDLIIDSIFDAVRALQPKSAVYGTLVGLINVQHSAVAEEAVSKLQSELQEALDDHAPLSIRGLCRFAAELMNARVLTCASVASLLESLLNVEAEEGVLPCRAEWFATLVLDCLILCGSQLSTREGERFTALLAKLQAFADGRATRPMPSLLRPFGADTHKDEVMEHFDALWAVVSECAEDGSWSFPCLLTPWRVFTEQFIGAESYELAPVTIPRHTTGCTYPSLRRLRLFQELPSLAGRDRRHSGESDAEMADDDEAFPAPLPLGERVLIEEYTWMLVNAFADSHKDGAKALAWQQEAFGLESSVSYVEVVFSMLMLLPTPRNKLVYYSCLLLDFSKLFTPVPHLLARAVNKLFSELPRLDVELRSRFVDWLSLHVSHFGFNLTPFGSAWSAHLSPPGTPPAERTAYDAFVTTLLQKCVALSYHERVQRELPEVLAAHMPPKPAGATAWAALSVSDTEPGAIGTKSAALLSRLRAKAEREDVLSWLDRDIDRAQLPVLVVHTLLDAGAKSVSHLEKLLDKFDWLVTHASADAAARVQTLAAVGSYWDARPAMVWLTLHKLLQYKLTDATAIVGWLTVSDAGRPLLETWGAWDAIGEQLSLAASSQRSATKAAEAEAERHAAMHADEHSGPERRALADERLEACRAKLADARREKKTLVANIYVGVCTALSEHKRGGGGLSEEWFNATLGHARALARRFIRELSLDTLELVIEGANVDADVQASLFSELRSLYAWLV